MAGPNTERFETIQRHLNNGRYSEAVDNLNIVLANSNRGPSSVNTELVALVPQLFPSLSNGNEEYIERCCSALEKMLQFAPIETVVRQMEVELKQGFEHPSPLVKCLCLKQLHRAISDRRNLKMVGETGIMKYAILLLSDEDMTVVKQCNKTLVTLSGYDEGIMILYSDQGIKLLSEVMKTSDTIRYRVFDIIIDSILLSDQALECANSIGFTTMILEDLESPDVLLRLTALENVSRLSDSPSAYNALRNKGIFKGIGAWLSANNPEFAADAAYTVPSVIKLFAKLAQKQNVNIEQFCLDCPEYLNTVCMLIKSSDVSVKYACIDVLTVCNARADGKLALLHVRDIVRDAVSVLAEDATRGSDDIKDRCLAALAHVFCLPEVYIPDFETTTECWFNACRPGFVKDALPLLSHPAVARQCSSASFLGNLAAHKYGIKAITAVPGWAERILDRSYCIDRDSQTKRYALVLAIKQSSVIQEFADRDILNKFTKYIHEGAYYRENAPPQAILEL